MKKLYSLLSAIICCSHLIAQPTFTSASIYGAGSVVPRITVDTTNINPGNAGANQTWNFANAVQASTLNFYFATAASTPYFSSFPTSNLAINTGVNTPNSYYTLSSSILVLNGLGLTSGGSNFIINYTNPETNWVFPLTYNTSYTDVFSGLQSTNSGGITVNTYRNGTITTVADGWGTVINPSGTYSNCLRTKSTQAIVDSTVYVGIPFPAEITLYNITSYSYTSLTNGKMVHRFILTYDTTETDFGGITIGKTCGYENTGVTGLISMDNINSQEITVSPNPARDFCYVELKDANGSEILMTISDVRGRMLSKETIVLDDKNKYQLDVQELNQGLHFATFRQGTREWFTKYIKY
ncbi:MAG: hypothetical protein IPO63_17975 [Bacteroidetes bacterium]|nr:hypothetical protein [Bacteroidota bacterium]